MSEGDGKAGLIGQRDALDALIADQQKMVRRLQARRTEINRKLLKFGWDAE